MLPEKKHEVFVPYRVADVIVDVDKTIDRFLDIMSFLRHRFVIEVLTILGELYEAFPPY